MDEESAELGYDIYDEPDREGLFEGDIGDIPPEARYATTRLLRDRYVSDEDPGKYRTSTYSLILQHREDVTRTLNNLCLTLNLNEKYRVAWAATAPFDGEMPGVVLKRGLVQKRDVTILLVTLRTEDFPGEGVLAGMVWQREIERRAFRLGGGNYRAPAQRVGDFLARVPSTGPGAVQPSYRPGVTWCELHELLPERISGVLERAIPALGTKLRGFDDPDAVLTAPETRSSSPVRLPRDEGCCSAIEGLFPCGEGAGYAGGITSAAVDGMRCAEAVLKRLSGQTEASVL